MRSHDSAGPLPFDERNTEDFVANTNKIEAALVIIAADHAQPVTKGNLSKLSGVHRNTLRNRALATSEQGSDGWPYSALAEIIRSRKASGTEEELTHVRAAASREDKIVELERRLALSRYQVASWHSRAIELKRERDEARRNVDLLLSQAQNLKSEVDRLRMQSTKNVKVVR